MTRGLAETRLKIMKAAVAAGGASAALMSFAVTCDDHELAGAADECLEPLLQGARSLLDAIGVQPGEDDRAALRDILTDYLAMPPSVEHSPEPGLAS